MRTMVRVALTLYLSPSVTAFKSIFEIKGHLSRSFQLKLDTSEVVNNNISYAHLMSIPSTNVVLWIRVHRVVHSA